MPDAQELIVRNINPRRLSAARAEAEQYLSFCEYNRLEAAAPDAVTLYLASHTDSGPQVRSRLARLDLWAQLTRQPPPGRTTQVRTYLRGHFGQHPLGPQLERAEPLYTPDVRALVDATQRPTWQQVRDAAFIVVMNASGLRQAELRRLRWQNVRLKSESVEIDILLRKSRKTPLATTICLSAQSTRDVCPVRWLVRLRQLTPLGDRTVFATRGERVATRRLVAYGHEIDRHRFGRQIIGQPTLDANDLSALVRRVITPLPIGHRDRTAILFGYLGGLTNREAASLRVGDVTVTRSGVVLRIASRRWPDVGLPRSSLRKYCPVASWMAWLAVLRQAEQAEPSDPVFVACDRYLPILGARPLSIDRLGSLVAVRAEQAGLIGQFGYTSLLSGFVRTATLSGVSYQDVATHIGQRTLDGVINRHRNETLLDASLLRRIGV